MGEVQMRTVSVPAAQAQYIDRQVANGTYGSVSEVVRAGLSALQEREDELEHWLLDDVAPTYDAMLADPTRAISAEQAEQSLKAHHAQRRGT